MSRKTVWKQISSNTFFKDSPTEQKTKSSYAQQQHPPYHQLQQQGGRGRGAEKSNNVHGHPSDAQQQHPAHQLQQQQGGRGDRGAEKSNNVHGHPSGACLIKEYTTNSGLNIICYKGDVTDAGTHGIVTTDNCSMPRPSKVTESLMEKAKISYKDLRRIVYQTYGTTNLKKGNVYSLDTQQHGIHVQFSVILLAISLSFDELPDHRKWKIQTEQLYRKILDEADSLRLKSLAVPLLGSGKAGASKELAVEALIASLSQYKPTRNLTDVYLVSFSEDVLNEITKQWDDYWSQYSKYTEREADVQKDDYRSQYSKYTQREADSQKDDYGSQYFKHSRADVQKDGSSKQMSCSKSSQNQYSPDQQQVDSSKADIMGAQKSNSRHDHNNSGHKKNYVTNNGLNVVCYKGDVTQAHADGIVIAEGYSMVNPSKVMESLLRKTKFSYADLKRCVFDKYRVTHLTIGEVYSFDTYCRRIELQFKMIYLAIIQSYAGTDGGAKWKLHMVQMYLKILKKADMERSTSLALPLLGSGNAGAPVELAITAVVTALSQYKPVNLTTVLLVNLDEYIHSQIVKTWEHHFTEETRHGQTDEQVYSSKHQEQAPRTPGFKQNGPTEFDGNAASGGNFPSNYSAPRSDYSPPSKHEARQIPRSTGPSHAYSQIPQSTGPSHAYSQIPQSTGPSHAYSQIPQSTGPSHAYSQIPQSTGPSHAYSQIPQSTGSSHAYNTSHDDSSCSTSIDVKQSQQGMSNVRDNQQTTTRDHSAQVSKTAQQPTRHVHNIPASSDMYHRDHSPSSEFHPWHKHGDMNLYKQQAMQVTSPKLQLRYQCGDTNLSKQQAMQVTSPKLQLRDQCGDTNLSKQQAMQVTSPKLQLRDQCGDTNLSKQQAMQVTSPKLQLRDQCGDTNLSKQQAMQVTSPKLQLRDQCGDTNLSKQQAMQVTSPKLQLRDQCGDTNLSKQQAMQVTSPKLQLRDQCGDTNLSKQQARQDQFPSEDFNKSVNKTKNDTPFKQLQHLYPVLDDMDNEPTDNRHLKEAITVHDQSPHVSDKTAPTTATHARGTPESSTRQPVEALLSEMQLKHDCGSEGDAPKYRSSDDVFNPGTSTEKHSRFSDQETAMDWEMSEHNKDESVDNHTRGMQTEQRSSGFQVTQYNGGQSFTRETIIEEFSNFVIIKNEGQSDDNHYRVLNEQNGSQSDNNHSRENTDENVSGAGLNKQNGRQSEDTLNTVKSTEQPAAGSIIREDTTSTPTRDNTTSTPTRDNTTSTPTRDNSTSTPTRDNTCTQCNKILSDSKPHSCTTEERTSMRRGYPDPEHLSTVRNHLARMGITDDLGCHGTTSADLSARTSANNPTGDSADNPTGDSADNPTGDSADNPTGDSADNPTGDSADNPTGDSADNPTGDAADNPTGDSADNPTGDSADNPTGDSADNPTGDSADNPTGDSADNPTGDSADNPTGDSADNPTGDSVRMQHTPTFQTPIEYDFDTEKEENSSQATKDPIVTVSIETDSDREKEYNKEDNSSQTTQDHSVTVETDSDKDNGRTTVAIDELEAMGNKSSKSKEVEGRKDNHLKTKTKGGKKDKSPWRIQSFFSKRSDADTDAYRRGYPDKNDFEDKEADMNLRFYKNEINDNAIDIVDRDADNVERKYNRSDFLSESSDPDIEDEEENSSQTPIEYDFDTEKEENSSQATKDPIVTVSIETDSDREKEYNKEDNSSQTTQDHSVTVETDSDKDNGRTTVAIDELEAMGNKSSKSKEVEGRKDNHLKTKTKGGKKDKSPWRIQSFFSKRSDADTDAYRRGYPDKNDFEDKEADMNLRFYKNEINDNAIDIVDRDADNVERKYNRSDFLSESSDPDIEDEEENSSQTPIEYDFDTEKEENSSQATKDPIVTVSIETDSDREKEYNKEDNSSQTTQDHSVTVETDSDKDNGRTTVAIDELEAMGNKSSKSKEVEGRKFPRHPPMDLIRDIAAQVAPIVAIELRKLIHREGEYPTTSNMHEEHRGKKSQETETTSNTLKEHRGKTSEENDSKHVQQRKKSAMAPRVNNENPSFSETAEKSRAIPTLLEEIKHLKEEKECKICFESELNIIFLPCGHLVCCEMCSNEVSECPVCRKHIVKKEKVYRI